MKIATLDSSRFYGSQIQSIEKGFEELGHQITWSAEEADCIYLNNPPFTEAIEAKRRGCKAKLIFTVLDIPEHLPDYDLSGLQRELVHADAICTISQFVQGQVKRFLQRDSHVIYMPIKPVYKDDSLQKVPYRFLHVGRRFDPNKRFDLAANALHILGVRPAEFALIGSEPVPGGNFMGVQTDENLNRFYNSADFVFATSEIEGLCLPVLEAMACGAIPVVCNTMTTGNELIPYSLFPEYAGVEPTVEGVAAFVARFMQNEPARFLLKQDLHGYFNRHWKQKTSPVGVAKAILDVYDSL